MTEEGLKSIAGSIKGLQKYWEEVLDLEEPNFSTFSRGKTRAEVEALINYYKGKYDAYCDIIEGFKLKEVGHE